MAYNGGKAGEGVAQRIINLMPPHRVYIEPFLGAGAVLRFKRPAAENVGIELDPQVIADYWSDPPEALTVICGDAFAYLRQREWYGGELIYLDPPYMPESRTSDRPLYRYEMDADGHRELLSLVLELRERRVLVLISGYYSRLYERTLKGWHLTTFGSMTCRGMALEHLWASFPPPLELHDYRFLGDDYRERERIKRKIGRWRAKLEAMPRLERQALLAALAETGTVGPDEDGRQAGA
jgi:DNA adenine methylase